MLGEPTGEGVRRDALGWEELLCHEERCPGIKTQGHLVPLPALGSQKYRAGPTWALGWSPCPVLCSPQPCQWSWMPNALERTQGLVTKFAGTLPRVCKLRSASRLLLLLFVFSSAFNSPSLSCGCCRPARRGTNKGVAWLSPGGAGGTALVLPLLPGLRTGTDLGCVSPVFPVASRSWSGWLSWGRSRTWEVQCWDPSHTSLLGSATLERLQIISKGFCTAPRGDFVPCMAEASKGKC